MTNAVITLSYEEHMWAVAVGLVADWFFETVAAVTEAETPSTPPPVRYDNDDPAP